MKTLSLPTPGLYIFCPRGDNPIFFSDHRVHTSRPWNLSCCVSACRKTRMDQYMTQCTQTYKYCTTADITTSQFIHSWEDGSSTTGDAAPNKRLTTEMAAIPPCWFCTTTTTFQAQRSRIQHECFHIMFTCCEVCQLCWCNDRPALIHWETALPQRGALPHQTIQAAACCSRAALKSHERSEGLCGPSAR